jgi:hypothetical protein
VIQAQTNSLSATHEMEIKYIDKKPVISDVNGEPSLLEKSSTRDWKEETGMWCTVNRQRNHTGYEP